jgi:hypothetical protein
VANKKSGGDKPSGKFKSAVTGHYVSPHYAKTQHPKTTYKTSK